MGVVVLIAIPAIAQVPAAQAVGPPSITDTDPDSPANENNPFVKGTVGDSDATQVTLYEGADCTGAPAGTGTVADFTGAGIAVSVPNDAVTVLTAIAADATGNDSACSAPFIYIEDSTAPAAPQITDTDPPSPGGSNSPQMKGTVDAEASQVAIYESSSCTGAPAATGTAAEFTGTGIAAAVAEGTTTAFSARATDAAGNASACSTALTYTADPTGACDKIASPPGSDGSSSSLYQTPQELIGSLASGQTGCFRAGTYTFPEALVTTANATLKPYGSEAVTLKGTIRVPSSGAGSTIEGFELNGAGGVTDQGPKIHASAVVLRDNEITNGHAATCVSVSSWFSDPPPQGVVIEHNRIHDCGVLPSTNKQHGIYLSAARDTVIRDNWIYDNADRGIQLYPDAQGSMVTGNVIEGNGDGLVINGSGASVSNDNVLEGNIIADSKLGWNVYSGTTGPVATGNFVRNNCVWASNGKPFYNLNGGIQTPSRNFTASDNLIAPPGFLAPAAGDFHLLSGDACLTKYTGTLSLPVGPPPTPQRTLTVQAQGAGTGTITGPGISCPGDCTETYTDGQQVSLTAAATGGSSFAAWGGACSGAGACQLTMDADKQATASFDPPPQRTLTVQAQGAGTGTITGPGISCPGDCTETYTDGQQVSLSANATGGSSFAAWGGACSGTGSCQLTMDSDKQATASFDPPPPLLYTLRPNVDLASAWRKIGATSAWAALDDNLLQPTAPTASDYIQPSAKSQVTTVGLQTQALNGAVPQWAVAWYYARTSTAGTSLQVDVRWAGATRATYKLPGNQAFAWRSLTVFPPNQAAVDDLNLRFTALGGTGTIVRAAYARLIVP